MSDDLYIPDRNNRAIDTQDFESELSEFLDKRSAAKMSTDAIYKILQDKIESRCERKPSEPDDDAIVCRFLDAAKFAWFCSSKELHFSRPKSFDDPMECRLHRDYTSAVQKVLTQLEMRPWEWDSFSDRERDDWQVSCWTLLQEHEPDYLLLHRYAGGSLGVGIAIRYGILKKAVVDAIEDEESAITKVICGSVDYSGNGGLAPFMKRSMFQNEKEVRFAFRERSVAIRPPVSLLNISDKFRIKFSPDAPPHHRMALEDLWQKSGFSVD